MVEPFFDILEKIKNLHHFVMISYRPVCSAAGNEEQNQHLRSILTTGIPMLCGRRHFLPLGVRGTDVRVGLPNLQSGT